MNSIQIDALTPLCNLLKKLLPMNFFCVKHEKESRSIKSLNYIRVYSSSKKCNIEVRIYQVVKNKQDKLLHKYNYSIIRVAKKGQDQFSYIIEEKTYSLVTLVSDIAKYFEIRRLMENVGITVRTNGKAWLCIIFRDSMVKCCVHDMVLKEFEKDLSIKKRFVYPLYCGSVVRYFKNVRWFRQSLDERSQTIYNMPAVELILTCIQTVVENCPNLIYNYLERVTRSKRFKDVLKDLNLIVDSPKSQVILNKREELFRLISLIYVQLIRWFLTDYNELNEDDYLKNFKTKRFINIFTCSFYFLISLLD